MREFQNLGVLKEVTFKYVPWRSEETVPVPGLMHNVFIQSPFIEYKLCSEHWAGHRGWWGGSSTKSTTQMQECKFQTRGKGKVRATPRLQSGKASWKRRLMHSFEARTKPDRSPTQGFHSVDLCFYLVFISTFKKSPCFYNLRHNSHSGTMLLPGITLSKLGF